jgi:UDP-glucose 4-epimerase
MQRTFAGKKALVTGGCGFIGSTLTRTLAELGTHVTVIDSMAPEYGGNWRNLAGIAKGVQTHIADVRDAENLPPLIRDQDYLFNLAGQTSHWDSMRDPKTDLEINAGAQLAILEACRHHNPEIRIVFASTRQVYGRPKYLPLDEAHPLRPIDVNGINKLAGESYHLLYHEVYGIRSTVLRLTNTIGPRMRVKDARQTFVGVWIRSLIDGIPFEVWGGDQVRDFTDVEDAVEAFLMAAAMPEAEGRVFNVGGTPPVSLRQLAELLIAIHNGGEFTVRSFPKDRRKIDIGDYYADYRCITDTLGWRPRTTLKTALVRTLDYYREEIAHYR